MNALTLRLEDSKWMVGTHFVRSVSGMIFPLQSIASAVLLGVPDRADIGGWGSRNSTPGGGLLWEKEVWGLGRSDLNDKQWLDYPQNNVKSEQGKSRFLISNQHNVKQ